MKARKNNIRTSAPVATKGSKAMRDKSASNTLKSLGAAAVVNRKKTTKK